MMGGCSFNSCKGVTVSTNAEIGFILNAPIFLYAVVR